MIYLVTEWAVPKRNQDKISNIQLSEVQPKSKVAKSICCFGNIFPFISTEDIKKYKNSLCMNDNQ